MLKKIIYRIASVLLLSIAVSVFNLQLVEANRITSIGPRRLANLHAHSPNADVGPCQSYIFVTILDVNASHIKAFPGATVNICVLFEVTWDVFDFDGFLVEAFYDGRLIDRESCIVLWSGHTIEHVNFAWNTSGVAIGSHSIWARAIATNVHTYTDGQIQILPVGNLNTGEGYSTMQEAINAASSGDTIFVKSGTYYEHVVINKTVSLVGEGKDNTILNGTTIEPVMIVEANNVKISGFTFEGWAFKNIVINATTGVIVVENKIVFNALGIDVEDSVNVTIENNIINGFGLDNIGIMLAYSSECRIVNNTITNAVYDGIRLWFASNNLIHQNLIKANDLGIFLHEANLNTISENTISESGGPGIYIESSLSNKVLHNSFMDNYYQAKIFDSSVNTWNNSCEGNYWSNYSGTDSDGDGVGDAPYVINSNNIDHCPLMNPCWNPADINHDLKVDLKDVFTTAKAYGSVPGSANWNPHCDIIADAIIDLKDYYAVCKSFGKSYTGT